MLNVLGLRVLPSAEATAYFAAHGMPVDKALLHMAGGWASSYDYAFYNDPALADFRAWTCASGKSTYLSFMAAYSADMLAGSLGEISGMLQPSLDEFLPTGYTPLALGLPDGLVYATTELMLALQLVGLFIILLSARQRQKTLPAAWLFPLVMIVLVFPLAVIVWSGDPLDFPRHSVQLTIQFRLGLWVLILLGADTLLHGRSRSAAASGVTQ